MASVGLPKEAAVGGGAQRSPPHTSQQQGQTFQPMDKSSSQTVKLNPKLELSHTELLKLLSYMEAELQARDVVIATLKTERIKSLLAYGRGGVHDPVLALQRDTGSATVTSSVGGGGERGSGGGAASGGGSTAGDPQQQMRGLQDTQLTQLEHLIAQQRKAHQRMRHVLREAEKRHSRVVGELEEERRKHEHDTAQGDDVTYALERDRARLKQSIESERSQRRAAEAEVNRMTADREEQRSRHKQMVLLLLEDRHRLAAQAAHHRQRAEDLAKVVSEEKGRMDGMAEGLEEESKKSLQMEAELEKQLAQFDTERQQMRALLQRRDDRVEELESQVEKLQRDVCHYQKQLQEAHNVAMFQQTLSVSPPRLASSHGGPSSSPLGGGGLTLPPSVSASVVTGITISQAPNIVSIPSLSQQQLLSSTSTSGVVVSTVSVTTLPSSGGGVARLPFTTAGAGSKTATLPSGLGSRPQPPQLPAKPPQLSHQQTRLPGTLPPPKVSARVRASSPGGLEDSLSSHSSLALSSSSHGGAASNATSPSLSHSPTPPLSYASPYSSGSSYSPGSTFSTGGGMQDASPQMVGVSKAVQLTATVNSVPVTLPTTGIARGVQPNRASVALYPSPALPPCGGEGCEVLPPAQPQVVQLSPRVNVSASGTGKVITSSQGGKFTFQVSTTSSSPSAAAAAAAASQQLLQQQQHAGSSCTNQSTQQQQVASSPLPAALPGNSPRKPLPPSRATAIASVNSSTLRSLATVTNSNSATVAVSRVPLHGPPPLPPNKPVLLSTTSTAKKEGTAPISLELKPHKLGPQTLKFGITISKTASINASPPALLGGTASTGDVDTPASLIDARRDTTQVTQTS